MSGYAHSDQGETASVFQPEKPSQQSRDWKTSGKVLLVFGGSTVRDHSSTKRCSLWAVQASRKHDKSGTRHERASTLWRIHTAEVSMHDPVSGCPGPGCCQEDHSPRTQSPRTALWLCRVSLRVSTTVSARLSVHGTPPHTGGMHWRVCCRIRLWSCSHTHRQARACARV